MRQKRNFITLLIVFLVLHQSNFLLSQTDLLGNPFIENFSKEDYHGGTQNWDSGVMKNGHVFIANNKGILEFDGVKWATHYLPNKTIARSLCITENRIYVGGQDELGYLAPSENGTLKFNSIREFIPDMYLPLQDVWQIKELNEKIYLRSVNRVYVFDPELNKFEVVDTGNPIISILKLNDKMFFKDLFAGIVSLSDTSQTYSGSEMFKFTPIIDVLPSQSDTLFISERFGIFRIKDKKIVPANQNTHEYLIQHGVFTTARLDDTSIAIGTQFGGIIIIDNHGKTIRKIDKEDGLINNNVHTIVNAPNGNLWVGTSNGISSIALTSPLKIIPTTDNVGGTFYKIASHENKLYFASNNGLYSSDLTNNIDEYGSRSYDNVTYSEGQVWGLNEIDGDLLMGHNNGAYLIQNGRAEVFSKHPGAWKFIEARNSKEMYVGTYTGVDIYKKEKDKWQFFKKLEGFVESARIMISVRENEVWISHPYRGVYKIIHDDNYFVEKVTLYEERQGLPSILANYIFEINGIPYVTAETGIYYYDRRNDRFELDVEMNSLIDSTKNVRRLFQESKDKIWFIAEHEAGYLEKTENDKYAKVVYPKLVDKFVNGFEEMMFYNDDQALICGINNVLSINTKQQTSLTAPSVFITESRLATIPDSILFGGLNSDSESFMYNQGKDQTPELNHKQNELLFTYSSPAHPEGISYSYALIKNKSEPDDNQWSPWTTTNVKEYNNLSSGKYLFSVRAKSQNDIIGKITTYKFEITPPWYLSRPAVAIYWLFALGGLAALVFIPQKKFKEEKKILTTAKEESDAELEKIKTEKLEAEIAFKNSELASSTMHLVQKNETINKLKAEIKNVSKKIKDVDAKKEIRKILSLFSDDERLEDDWENFSINFDQVHTNFLKRLSHSYPQLTPKDKKMCAYLRMNLSSKEIAPLLNISVRGVEISRYRLRKKIELDGSINLNEFMMNY